MLYFWNNETSGTPPPVDGSLQAVQVKHLFNVTGDSQVRPEAIHLQKTIQ